MRKLAMKLLLLLLLATAPAFATQCGYPFVGGTTDTLGNYSYAVTACTPIYDSTVNFAAIYTIRVRTVT